MLAGQKEKAKINLLTFFRKHSRKQTKQKTNVRKENAGKINKKRKNCAKKKNLDKWWVRVALRLNLWQNKISNRKLEKSLRKCMAWKRRQSRTPMPGAKNRPVSFFLFFFSLSKPFIFYVYFNILCTFFFLPVHLCVFLQIDRSVSEFWCTYLFEMNSCVHRIERLSARKWP